MNVTSEEFGTENVTVTVEWAQQVGEVYNATVLSPASLMFTGNASLQLELQYNTEYNLSVEAGAQCGANATAFILLNYGEA